MEWKAHQKKKILRMLGIAENDHPASSNGNDLTKVRELLGKLEVNYTSIFVRRLGIAAADKTRPLLITLPNEQAVYKALARKRKLPQGISIFADLTPSQQ